MDENTRIPMLEPYIVKQTVSALSETTDYNHQMLNIPEMWKQTMGEGVKVVVLDTGCPQHIDLKIAGCKDFVSSASPYDTVAGHSTHVCGIIGATVNGIGVKGIAPKCQLYCGKVLDDDGAGSVASIVAGIRWAVDQVHADIINMSLGCPPYSALIPSLRAACKYAYDNGVVVCCAAGNDAGAVNAPANMPTTVAVAAVDRDRKRAYFTCHGSEVDFAAGGVDVFSTWLGNTYAKLSGTSMATPVITGAFALVIGAAKAAGEHLTPDEAYARLASRAIDVDVPGKDEYTGYGIPLFVSSAGTAPDTPGEPGKPALEQTNAPRKASWFARLVRWLGGIFGR